MAVPAPRPDRPALHRLLDAATGRRICLVVAAAGWGKSTAVASWSRDRPTVWVRCEDNDVGPHRLVAGLVRALNGHLGAPGIPLPGPAEGGLDAARRAARTVCGWLHGHPGPEIVLVVEDLHASAPGGPADVVEVLVRHAPPRLRLILVSRQEPRFPLSRLRGRGQVAEIHAADLAFTTADVEAVLQAAIGAPPAGLAQRVRECTAGWPAAVVAAVEAVSGVGGAERAAVLRRLSRPGERFHDFLVEEVLGAEPAGVKDLLRSLAVCDEPGPSDPAGLLPELTRRGLVVAGPGSDRSVVPPLRDHLRHDPELTPADRVLLHSAAARACAARGDHAAALRHLVTCGAPAAVAALLAEHGGSLVRRGEIDAVLAASGLLGRDLGDPRIQLVLGQAMQVRGRWTAAAQHYRAAAARGAPEPATAWRAGSLALVRGELAEALALCRVDRAGGAATADEVQALALAATVARMTGDLDGARAALAGAEAGLDATGDPALHAAVHLAAAMVAAATGDRPLADARWAAALGSVQGAGYLLDAAWIRCWRAEFLADTGASRYALAEAGAVAEVARACDSPYLAAHAESTRARAWLRLGMLDKAQECAEPAVAVLRRLGSRYAARALCTLGDVSRIRGRAASARLLYEEALALADPVGDRLGACSALAGLARVRAADDPATAAAMAQRAAGVLADAQLEVDALLARGWVALLDGDRAAAGRDAAAAEAAARRRRHGPGAAEALTLAAMAVDGGAERADLLDAAVEIYAEHGCVLEEATAAVVAARTGSASGTGSGPVPAERVLAAAGVAIGARRDAGLLAAAARAAEPVLCIRALGAFLVLRDGVPVPRTAWQSRKARDLLKILVARRRPVPREQLIELLWPNVEPARAGNRLSVLLSMLRDTLAPARGCGEPVVTDGGAIGLNRDCVHVDVERFLDDADAALAAHRGGAADAVARLAGAVEAYTGDFLEDDPYPDWTLSPAEELRATHIALLQALTVQLRRRGDVDGLVRYALRLLGQDPYDEAAHRTLVQALAEAGRLGEARRHHDHYRRRMAEIGVPVAPVPGLPGVLGRCRPRRAGSQ